MPEIKKTCKSCKQKFVLTEDDQKFFEVIAEKMYKSGELEAKEDFVLPERCIECRRKRRQMRR